LATGADVEGAGEEAAGKDIVSMTAALGRIIQLKTVGLGVSATCSAGASN
jgi:hypothetical protein